MPNKIGAAVKSNVIGVFDKIGGRDAMAEWARENKTEFYKLYAKLIPTETINEHIIRDASDLTDGELLAIAAASSPRTAGETSGEGITVEIH
jgi:hypothetical protein